MIDLHADVAIIGSGFGGSLTALLLARIGRKVVLIDRAGHPRFALGESSTPIADLVLQSLARQYDLPRIAPLAEYGSWQTAYPGLPCGLKRGFSYFRHFARQRFTPTNDHANELLVAASAGPADADTHWLRADFDAFLVREVLAEKIPFCDSTNITELLEGEPWRLVGERQGEPVRITADFLIDASGDGCVVARHLAIPNTPDRMRTSSRALYGHFTNVALWRDQLIERGGASSLADHVFPCDDAALHHILDGGWMWVLRFNNGVTSAGFMLDSQRYPLDPAVSPDEEWDRLLQQYPSIGDQFRSAKLSASVGTLRRTGRLQRRATCCAGPNWAMLPLTAYSLDALHSTGNAHTLCGIERLIGIFDRRLGPEALYAALQDYSRSLQSEIDLLDQIVHGCYSAFSCFELLTTFAMYYFAGATVSEDHRRTGRHQPADRFLLAHDAQFRERINTSYGALLNLTRRGQISRPEIDEFQSSVASALEPYNIAGLCDPSRRNMYPFPGPCGTESGV